MSVFYYLCCNIIYIYIYIILEVELIPNEVAEAKNIASEHLH